MLSQTSYKDYYEKKNLQEIDGRIIMRGVTFCGYDVYDEIASIVH